MQAIVEELMTDNDDPEDVGHSLFYELAYGKGLTPFLALAGQSGARAQADGVGMLVEQAAEAFALWRGVRPETRKVIDALAVPLS